MLHAPLPSLDTLETWLTMARGRLARDRARAGTAMAWQAALRTEALQHLTAAFGVCAATAEADLTLELSEARDPMEYLEELVLRQRMLIHFEHVRWAAPAIRGAGPGTSAGISRDPAPSGTIKEQRDGAAGTASLAPVAGSDVPAPSDDRAPGTDVP